MTAQNVAALEDRYEELCVAQMKAVMKKDYAEVDRLQVEIAFAVSALGVEMTRTCPEFTRGAL